MANERRQSPFLIRTRSRHNQSPAPFLAYVTGTTPAPGPSSTLSTGVRPPTTPLHKKWRPSFPSPRCALLLTPRAPHYFEGKLIVYTCTLSLVFPLVLWRRCRAHSTRHQRQKDNTQNTLWEVRGEGVHLTHPLTSRGRTFLTMTAMDACPTL